MVYLRATMPVSLGETPMELAPDWRRLFEEAVAMDTVYFT